MKLFSLASKLGLVGLTLLIAFGALGAIGPNDTTNAINQAGTFFPYTGVYIDSAKNIIFVAPTPETKNLPFSQMTFTKVVICPQACESSDILKTFTMSIPKGLRAWPDVISKWGTTNGVWRLAKTPNEIPTEYRAFIGVNTFAVVANTVARRGLTIGLRTSSLPMLFFILPMASIQTYQDQQ